MAKRFAYIFPGLASQYPGMGKELIDQFPEARAVFNQADEILGFSLLKLCFESKESELIRKPAANRLASELDRMHLGKFSFPVLKNIDAKAYYSTDEIPGSLKLQITQPVLWQDCAENLLKSGSEHMVEVGPGKVLTGLVKRINRSINLLSVENIESAQTTVNILLQ